MQMPGRGSRSERRAARSRVHRVLRRAGIILAAAIGLVVLLGLAGTGLLYYQGTRAPAGGVQYVALGSSFAAGPGVGLRAPDSPTACTRSAGNYAALLADRQGLDLTDVSCSGATTVHVLEGGQYFQPAQLDALHPDTQLVTVTIGGNDVSYLGDLIAWSCQANPDVVPFLWQLLACSPTPQAQVEGEFEQLAGRMTRIAEEVQERSPEAVLVLVDYVTVLPGSGSCPDRLPVTDEQLERGRHVAARLAAVTAAVADESGARLVQASELTRGHDVCSTDAWVSGHTMPATPLTFAPLAYHPTEEAMQVVSDAIAAALERAPGAD